MAKTGRNAPCPCGSGKKFKRCCMGSSKGGPASREPRPTLPEPGHPSASRGPPPWAAARWTGERHPDWPAAPARVAAMSTEEILRRLADLGVSVTRERFLELAEGRQFAWTISNVWREETDRELDGPDDWFLVVSAVELFRRWLPDTITMEVLDRWMQEGYERDMAGDFAAAVRLWLDLYREIRTRIPRSVTNIDAAEAAFWGEQSIGNWLQDLALALTNAALDNPELAREGDRFFRRLLARFPDTDTRELDCFRRDHAEVLAHFDPDKAVRILEAMLEHGTQLGATYSALDLILRGGSPDRAHLDQAIAHLEQAISRPDVDAGQYDLESRLEEARRAREDLDAQ